MRIREAGPCDARGIAPAFIDSLRMTHAAHLPPEYLDRLSYAESQHNWARTLHRIGATPRSDTCIYVAEERSGRIVGVAMGGPERTQHPCYAGEVYVLYLLPPYQRQGLGRRLLQAVVHRLGERGMHSILIRVLVANEPARRFYEALGGSAVLEEQCDDGGVVVAQVAYGWTAAQALLARLPCSDAGPLIDNSARPSVGAAQDTATPG